MTPNLYETLKLAARGLSDGEIAQELGISLPAARDRMRRLLALLEVRNRTELVARCYRERIV